MNDEIIPASRYIREDDFFFYEMHMGGCGGYITSTLGDKYGVRGATLGLGFGMLIYVLLFASLASFKSLMSKTMFCKFYKRLVRINR